MNNRDQIIIRTGIVGIVANIFLASVKVFIGFISGSIAIVLDGANNLSDALSSVITIVGTKLSNKPADNKHPLGYGRIEYLTTLFIAGLVLFAGFTSLIESVKKIINPEVSTYSTISLFVLIIAIFVKIILGRYTKAKGEQVDSDALIASGIDATGDAVLSTATVIGALLTKFVGFSIESYLALVISIVIIKSGFEILMEVLNQLLGSRADIELVKAIKADINSFENVLGAYDLFLDSYGPKRMAGSCHIEIPDSMTATQIDELSREIMGMIYQKYEIILTIGIYAVAQKSELYQSIRKDVLAYQGVLQMHGYHVDGQDIYFDVVRDFDVKDTKTWITNLHKDLESTYSNYHFHITVDIDY